MRVLIFSTDDFLHPAGGAEAAIEEITKRLPHIEFDLLCARLRKAATPRQVLGNVTIHRIGFGIPKIDGFMLAVFGPRLAARLHKQKPYDLAWAMLASYGAAAAARVKQQLGLPYVLDLQEGDDMSAFERKLALLFLYSGNFFAQADATASISRYLDAWGRRMGYAGSKNMLIPNGVDFEVFADPLPPAKRKEIRAAWGFSDAHTVLVTTSRLVEKNGVGDLLEALLQLPEQVVLVVAGDGALGESLKTQAHKLGVSNRVTFLGYMKRTDIPPLLHASDIFCRPSLSEGLGNSFLEAMAARLPVIGALVGGIPDFLFDGETGFACLPKDPASIALKVREIMGLPSDKKEEMLNRAQDLVKEKYTWDRIALKVDRLFASIAKS